MFTYLFRHHVSQFDILRPRNRCGAMVVDQFVAFCPPQKEFDLGVAKYLKLLDHRIGQYKSGKIFRKRPSSTWKNKRILENRFYSIDDTHNISKH